MAPLLHRAAIIIRRLVSSVRRRHTAAGRHESQRRHTSPREARQLLGCCPVLVPVERSAAQRGQVGGRHTGNSTSAPIGCHYPSGLGRQQAAGRTQAEVARRNNRFTPAVRLPCQRCSKGVQLPHTRPIRHVPSLLSDDMAQTVTGQLADTPTRGLPTRGLDISRTGQLAD